MSGIQREDEGDFMKAILFPGQGSQFRGMGKELFPLYREMTETASDILGYSIEKLCTEDPDGKLNLTQYTQPALYVVNALGYRKRRDEGMARPDFVAGHSLGEYNALLAADVFDFKTGLRLVQRRGELMGAAREGGMAAVIGIDEASLAALLKQHQLTSIDLANFNTLSQTVIAGPKDAIAQAEKLLTAQQIRCAVLNVSAAFHSRYMEEAKQAFAAFLRQFRFDAPGMPVIANVSARPYRDGEAADLLARQISSPVRWTDTVRYLMGAGVTEFVEVGATVLTRLVEDIRKTATPLLVAQAPIPAAAPAAPAASGARPALLAENLGSALFRKRFGVKYAYIAGAMYRGIAAPKLVVRMGKAGLVGFFGTGGLSFADIEKGIQYIQGELRNGEAYGLNLLANYAYPELERQTVDLYLRYNVRLIEAAAFMQMTPALVLFRLKGLKRGKDGQVEGHHRILAKVSRPEVAEVFLRPAPEHIVQQLLKEGQITLEQAELAKRVPVSEDVCIEADSGGHTDGGIPTVLFPAMLALKRAMEKQFAYAEPICMGLAGGIGTPEAAAAAFMMGADFILTGSINQCTVDAGTSDDVKTLLQDINVQDTDYAPAGDMFETGAQVQVLKKGVFFPTRANKLFSLYHHHDSLDDLPEKTKKQLQTTYFKKTFEEVWNDVRKYLEGQGMRHEIVKAEANPKHKMALVFRWYFGYTSRLALAGSQDERVNYQVHTGPALGAFNQWVKGTPLESWSNRHADEIGKKLLTETAEYLNLSLDRLFPLAAA
ncbi:ACP S-malonyltransferase [Janthinobacterium fluminis]|uniref:[acyl-carrier-protein] S-malonyltransferase n=1 Tax=Janthinobacterium fluminis TaxID=2987524 RepID=A0ABT5K0H1_9BURK|nr:ACP S-malonyltransferase [Janthinobacterium fluminis]MDC8758419.1 ACP S-malonyltransferase [Janthinobacterium fluminis]